MDELTDLEAGLRKRLHHVKAPEGFTDRVVARVEARSQSHRAFATLHISRTGWLAIAAALILSISAGEALHVHHQHQLQAVAQAEMDRALQLTNHAMNEVETGFERSSAGRYAKLWNNQ